MNVYGYKIKSNCIFFDKLNKLNYENAPLFVCDDFVTCKALYQAQYDYFYSRWTIHAISEHQEDELLANITSSLKTGGLLFIEARSIHDELCGQGEKLSDYEYIHDAHYRRFIDKDKLVKKLVSLGYEIIYAEENDGFSITNTSNPTLIRIVAKYNL